MKITIPKEYRSKFENNEAYITRWINRSILVTNKRIRDIIVGNLEAAIKKGDNKSAFARLMKAGIFKVKLKKGGSFVCPKWLEEWLGEGELHYLQDKLGVLVSSKVS